ncbi:unnamed protein product [Auanema sp. JU1783]|nr:unnamed protein product [Auanema sp. JU1783]
MILASTFRQKSFFLENNEMKSSILFLALTLFLLGDAIVFSGQEDYNPVYSKMFEMEKRYRHPFLMLQRPQKLIKRDSLGDDMKTLTVLFIVAASIVTSTHARLQPIRRITPDIIRSNQSSILFSEKLLQDREDNYDQLNNHTGVVYRPFKNVKSSMMESNRIDEPSNKSYRAAATCPDRDIARFLNYAITTYIHDMDGLSRYVLNQIISSRKPGKWLVHAQVISGTRQGRDWQTSTNAEIFSQKDQYACFYHDNLTYILNQAEDMDGLSFSKSDSGENLPDLKRLTLETAEDLRKNDSRFSGLKDIIRNLYTKEDASMSSEEAKEWCKENHLEVYPLNEKMQSCHKNQPPYTTFESAFSKYPEIMREIQKNNFVKPTPIQSQMWPTLLSGQDCVGISQTGSGKTLAFLLPAFLHIDAQRTLYKEDEKLPRPFVLILTPTRELAQQIHGEIRKYSYNEYRSVCLYGGAPRRKQLESCDEGVEIVIATPGRLADLAHEGVISLASITYTVLDEADRMLDMGFEPSIRRIMFEIRTDRLVALTSATWPESVRKLVGKYTKDAIMIVVGSLDLTPNKSVTQYFEFLKQFEKFERVLAIVNLLNHNFGKTYKLIIFVKSKVLADHLSSDFCLQGIDAQGLHSGRSQEEREQSLHLFRKGKIQILIATDLASRGIDVPDITHVINYDFPDGIEEYVHRIGRTGRAGREGDSLSFMTWHDRFHAESLISLLLKGEQKVPKDLHYLARRHNETKDTNVGNSSKPQFRRRRNSFQLSY